RLRGRRRGPLSGRTAPRPRQDRFGGRGPLRRRVRADSVSAHGAGADGIEVVLDGLDRVDHEPVDRQRRVFATHAFDVVPADLVPARNAARSAFGSGPAQFGLAADAFDDAQFGAVLDRGPAVPGPGPHSLRSQRTSIVTSRWRPVMPRPAVTPKSVRSMRTVARAVNEAVATSPASTASTTRLVT